MTEQRYEVYMDLYKILEYRDGAVYRTEYVCTDWFRKEDVDGNVSAATRFLFVAADNEFARTHMTIRLRKEPPADAG